MPFVGTVHSEQGTDCLNCAQSGWIQNGANTHNKPLSLSPLFVPADAEVNRGTWQRYRINWLVICSALWHCLCTKRLKSKGLCQGPGFASTPVGFGPWIPTDSNANILGSICFIIQEKVRDHQLFCLNERFFIIHGISRVIQRCFYGWRAKPLLSSVLYWWESVSLVQ